MTLGDSLWKISERVYGDPYRWVEIYEANIDKIENPDLIYSGQELELRLHSANTDKISVAVEEGPSNSVPTNDSLTFTNPYGGSGNDAVADDYTEWNFRAVVTDTDGYTNLDTVVLRLANSSDNTTPYDALKFTWTESTDAFSETTDTQNAATITSTGSDSSCDGNTCTLDFKIKLNNNFLAKDTNYNAELYTTDDDPATDEDTYTNFYQVTTV
ncbi:MAG: LysM peptidoglycan-binding domain-containing protein, partial [Patescibacteria group bacterium]|nr:LysM peptidoglycan-binding domain-containing protein [Patescibacteria group bacterium]